MSRLSRLTYSALILATLAMGATAQAATYYVSTTGSDGAPGTIDAPWRTVTKAAATMLCGDTTYVRGGTYTTEGAINFSRTGCTALTPITLQAYPGESPIIHWTTPNAVNKINIYSGTLTIPVSDVIIDGFELWGGNDGIKLTGTLRTIIRNNTIHGSTENGITAAFRSGNKSVTITRNRIYDNGDYTTAFCGGDPRCNKYHGMYLTGTDWTVTNNLIYDNMASGIQLAGYAYVVGDYPDATYATFQGLVANNTIAYQRNVSGIYVWASTGKVVNTTIENNIFYENAQSQNGYSQAINFTSCDICTGTIRNNVYYGTGTSTGFSSSNGANPPAGFAVSATTNSNPLFVNGPATVPAALDFHLTTGSVARGLGANLTANGITTDFDGRLRPPTGPWDGGAHLFTNNDTASPAPPRGLQVN